VLLHHVAVEKFRFMGHVIPPPALPDAGEDEGPANPLVVTCPEFIGLAECPPDSGGVKHLRV
jgi:hypothetical protein